jgi:hypothetical protein
MSLFSYAAFELLSVGDIGVLNVLGAVPLAAYRAFGHESSPSKNTTIECNIPKAEVVRVMLLIAFKDGNRLTHFVLFKTDGTFSFILLIERSSPRLTRNQWPNRSSVRSHRCYSGVFERLKPW